MNKILQIICCSFFLLVSCSKKDSNPISEQNTSISGKIIYNSSEHFFSGALITTEPATSIIISDCSGNFIIPNIQPGNYTLLISLNGYYYDTIYVNAILGENNLDYISLTSIPPELVNYFTASGSSSVRINWETETETTNQGFEIERSSGKEFTTIGFVEGAGTSTQSHSYTYIDSNVDVSKTYYYRLKQISFDSSYRYSYTVKNK